jgi:hypothetical protein
MSVILSDFELPGDAMLRFSAARRHTYRFPDHVPRDTSREQTAYFPLTNTRRSRQPSGK